MLIRFFQFLPQFKGKARISRFFFKKYIREKKDLSVKGAHGLTYKIPNLVEPVGYDILIHGIHEKETSSFIVSQLPKNGVFFDLGANIGSITMPVSRQRPDVKIFCVEASPRVYSYLDTNVKTNALTNCTLVNNAIDETDGVKVRFYSQQELFGTGSMSAVFTDQFEEIETVTLDTLMTKHNVSHIDFIKIDIEGYEYFAFKGGQKALSAPNAPDILFEFIDWAEKHARDLKLGSAQEILMSYGYKIYEFQHGKIVGEPLIEPIVKEGWNMLVATKRKR